MKKIALDSGGLYIIGTERHESRRMDNQLRGRSGRQGDPGSSKFFLSLEDDLMRIFGSEKLDTVLQTLGLEENECIQHPWITKALERAQKKVEGRNFEIRKSLLRFDDVMNEQRKIIYQQRMEIINDIEIDNLIFDMRDSFIDDFFEDYQIDFSQFDEEKKEKIKDGLKNNLNIDLEFDSVKNIQNIQLEDLVNEVKKLSNNNINLKKTKYTEEVFLIAQKSLLLQIIDKSWKDHLLSLDHLRQGISLRAYGQKDPLSEFKKEAFSLFEILLEKIKIDIIKYLFNLNIVIQEKQAEDSKEEIVPTEKKVGRNEKCPCGSGKKFKHCCGNI